MCTIKHTYWRLNRFPAPFRPPSDLICWSHHRHKDTLVRPRGGTLITAICPTCSHSHDLERIVRLRSSRPASVYWRSKCNTSSVKYLHKGNKSSAGERNEKAARSFDGIAVPLLATKQSRTRHHSELPGLIRRYVQFNFTFIFFIQHCDDASLWFHSNAEVPNIFLSWTPSKIFYLKYSLKF